MFITMLIKKLVQVIKLCEYKSTSDNNLFSLSSSGNSASTNINGNGYNLFTVQCRKL